ncbi:MAG: site-specific DNA-methyltransferase [Chloroflexota bacterium]|nr:site-specific DNA-methyltransferase [Chloroflexota bacterium]
MTELIWDGKYDKNGQRCGPVRLALPFQDVETVNESAQTRNLMLDLWGRGQTGDWRNRLIWGDKRYVLPSLLPEFAGKVNLIYIDPPFATGADFSYTATLPNAPDTKGKSGTSFVKEPSVIEQKAYRDTWGRGLDSYLQWFYETAVLLHDLLADDGSLYVHLDAHVAHYVKALLDEVFPDGFVREIIWRIGWISGYKAKALNWARNHDTILYYKKAERFTFNKLYIPHAEGYGRREAREVQILNEDAEGNLIAEDDGKTKGKPIDDVWVDLPSIQIMSFSGEKTGYATQKNENLLERIINTSSNPGDLVLDCFCGSGTTAAVAERLGRRWITCDLGRFAIHTARKRLLALPDVRPFVVQNLGKYERQAWQAAEFGGDTAKAAAAQAAYRRFILQLYGAESLDGYTWLHGVRAGRMVHVGSVDAPVLAGDLTAITQEFWKTVGKGSGATVNEVDVLGWDFAFEVNEMGKQATATANVGLNFKRIPREVLEKKAVEQGDIRFFELAALATEVAVAGRQVRIALTDFVVPPDDVPASVQGAITHWSQLIDYWAVDWDYRGDTFHNQWQAYRSKKQPKLALSAANSYAAPGPYTILIKVIDILGNDTTKSVQVTVG